MAGKYLSMTLTIYPAFSPTRALLPRLTKAVGHRAGVRLLLTGFNLIEGTC